MTGDDPFDDCQPQAGPLLCSFCQPLISLKYLLMIPGIDSDAIIQDKKLVISPHILISYLDLGVLLGDRWVE